MLTSQCGKRWPLPNGRSGVLCGPCTTGGLGDCCGTGESESDVGPPVFQRLFLVASRAGDCPGAPSACAISRKGIGAVTSELQLKRDGDDMLLRLYSTDGAFPPKWVLPKDGAVTDTRTGSRMILMARTCRMLRRLGALNCCSESDWITPSANDLCAKNIASTQIHELA
jgi:hypothetical protein